jgi:hypothetical protein
MAAPQNLNVPIQNFLIHLNYNNIYLYPFNNNPNEVAIYARNNTRIRVLTGEVLLMWNVEQEAHRLQMNNRNIIRLATTTIWNLHLNILQRNQFTNLAIQANIINQDYAQVNNDTLNRIVQMNSLQETNTLFESDFFNGSVFSDNDGLIY